MRRLLGAAASVLGALLLLGAAPPTAAPIVEDGQNAGVLVAGVDDFSFESLDVDYTLGRDESGASTLRVVETFVAVFPDFDQNRGMRRSIPDSYNGQPLEPRFVSITDGDGAARPAEVEQDDGEFTMTSRASQYVHGRQVYVFTYMLRHVTWRFDDTGDEFYWDVNGTDWSQSFGRVTAALHVDDELADAMTGRFACYQGGSGSTQRCDIAVRSDGATVAASSGPLRPYQTMTIAVGFADGTFVAFDTSYLASPWGWLQGLSWLGLLGSLGGAIAIRSRRLRDDPGRSVIIAEYEPPKGLDALQSAVLLGLPNRAIPAEVLEQAVVGSIRIVEGDRRAFGGHRLRAELVDPSRADGDGRMLLDGLFGPGASPGSVFEFGRSDTRMSSAARQILSWAGKELERQGIYRTVPRRLRTWPILLALGFALASFLFGIGVVESGRSEGLVVALGVLSIPVFLAVTVLVGRKPKSARGAELRDHLKGVKEFIAWAEADRIRMLQSPSGAERRPVDPNDPRQMLHLYESLLPYAVVFGLEKQWGEQLAMRYGDESPVWYSGTHGFQAAAFAAGISTLSSSAASSSSTSGGSGGGGSAGGGGGGGGGGGV